MLGVSQKELKTHYKSAVKMKASNKSLSPVNTLKAKNIRNFIETAINNPNMKKISDYGSNQSPRTRRN